MRPRFPKPLVGNIKNREGNVTPVSFLVDGVKAVGVHNGVVRIAFMTLTVDGEASEDVRLLIPQERVEEIAEVLGRFGAPDREHPQPEKFDPSIFPNGQSPFAVDDEQKGHS